MSLRWKGRKQWNFLSLHRHTDSIAIGKTWGEFLFEKSGNYLRGFCTPSEWKTHNSKTHRKEKTYSHQIPTRSTSPGIEPQLPASLWRSWNQYLAFYLLGYYPRDYWLSYLSQRADNSYYMLVPLKLQTSRW